jgi:hypothetical protein
VILLFSIQLQKIVSNNHNFLHLRSFPSQSDDKLNLLTFVQVAETFAQNGYVMNEDIFTKLALNEAVALRAVESFHISWKHPIRQNHVSVHGSGKQISTDASSTNIDVTPSQPLL